jgi:glycerophosphoryl diester phosphodiesterase
VVLGPDGREVGAYEKTHLTAAEEAFGCSAGSTPAVLEWAGLRVGFAVCFDIYFPDYVEALAAAKVDLLLCPSYQRSESAERIRLLSACRALDAGAYLLRSAYAMATSGLGGHSLAAAPDGSILADAGETPGALLVEFDPGRKFVKPASHGRPPVEHRALIESRRRPALYRPRRDRAAALAGRPFPRLCAHRGLSLACPENTLPAFAAAVAAGADELELDLWLSRDGVAVVCHDESLDRTTDAAGRIMDMAWSDIRKADAGIRCGEAWRGVPVPRFEEVLEAVDGRAGINIHIKHPGPDDALVRQVCDRLRAEAALDLCYVAGDEEVLRAAQQHAPDVARACLAFQDQPDRMIASALAFGCRRVQFGRDVDDAQIRRARAEGLLCNLFWSNEPADAREYVRRGIDVILTDCAHQMIGRV